MLFPICCISFISLNLIGVNVIEYVSPNNSSLAPNTSTFIIILSPFSSSLGIIISPLLFSLSNCLLSSCCSLSLIFLILLISNLYFDAFILSCSLQFIVTSTSWFSETYILSFAFVAFPFIVISNILLSTVLVSISTLPLVVVPTEETINLFEL